MSSTPAEQSESSTSSPQLGLSPSDLQDLAALTTPKLTKYIPQVPTEKQAAFLLVDAKDVLFGGAAGGAKSSGLLMAGLQYVDVKGYAGIIFRRTYADLAKPGALMDRAFQWLGPTDAKWKHETHTWHFPSGATLSFGHLETEKAKYDHQGAEYQFIGFDELTQFTETMFRYLFSRLRRLKDSAVPLRMRGASNPGGDGHEWVHRRYFGDRVKGRVFIPSKLEDNPHLDRVAYEESLNELDPVTRRQLRHGDWNVREPGEYFKREWFKDRIVDRRPKARRWVRFWDFAATEVTAKAKNPDWCVGTLMGELDGGEYCIADVARFRKPPAATDAEVVRIALLDGVGVEQHFEQEPGASSKILLAHYQREVLKGLAVYGHTSSKHKVTRAKPFSAACEQRRVQLVRAEWNSGWFDRMEAFPTEGVKDDEVDSSSGAYNQLHRANAGAPIAPLAPAERTGLSGMEM